ncbi:MAG TPA: ABC transporter permease [Caldisericia bacterium]|nr:ABC transporter permease [Caldisericia bacterium]HPO29375.1 ABC transporter permease [Caldisericia bacterium]HXK70237.1 ABC transporter permease [Caldisericia bacterium]
MVGKNNKDIRNYTSSTENGLTEISSAKEYTYFQMVAKRFFRHKLAVVGLVIITVLVLMAVLAPLLSKGVDPSKTNLLKRFLPPLTEGHLLGTDDVGRDEWARILYGGRISLLIGFLGAVSGTLIGGIVGSISGYYGGMLDSVIMRIVEIFFCVPTLPILVVFARIWGGSMWNILIILVIFGWAGTARLVRGMVLSIKESEFIEASRAIGCSDARIILRHIFPNTLAILLVSITLSIGGVIIYESTLSFLGLGIDPSTPTWGNMLQNAQNFLWNAPHLVIWPGLFIFLAILSFNFIGDGLRDALDPKLKI